MEHIENTGESFGYLEGVFREYLPKNANPRILDVGAGYGQCSTFLKKKGYDVFAADVDEKLVSDIKALFVENGFDPNHALLIQTGNSYTIPMPDKFFDIILCLTVFEHVRNLDETLKEMCRVLKDDGFIFAFFPSSRSLIEAHTGIPFVHWLPYSKFRENYIRIFSRMLPIEDIQRTASYLNTALWDNVFYPPHRKMDRIISRYFHINFMAYSDHHKLLTGEGAGKSKNFFTKAWDLLHRIFHTRYLILKKRM